MARKPAKQYKDTSEQGEQHRQAMAARSRELSASVSDIGELPPVADPDRKERCRLDLLSFLVEYFPHSTGLHPFSDDHIRVIRRMEHCILHGGRVLNAVYRGFAKTTISENAAIWATIYGHRAFVPVFGAAKDQADQIISSIKLELEENELLYADFPEVCHAIRAIEGKPQRCLSQTYQGKRTHIVWKADQIVMPDIPGSAASGSIIVTRGLMSGARGMKQKTPDGKNLRPDFCIIDDPQTDESAGTAMQVAKRLAVINKSILKMAGHDKRVSCVLNGTVIAKDDLVDQLLDPAKNPAWQGERIPMVKSWAKSHDAFWLGEYATIRNTFDRNNPKSQEKAHKAANTLYRKRRAEADAGCEVSWLHCYDHDAELSAIQHAYNALIDDGPEVFASEYQNEPTEEKDAAGRLKPDLVCSRANGRARGEVPLDASRLTAFVDIHDDLLFWCVVAWTDRFVGFVVDYGTMPDQGVSMFEQGNARKPLAAEFKGAGVDGAIQAGLDRLVKALLQKAWPRAGGAQMRIGKLLVDMGYKAKLVAAVKHSAGGATMDLCKGYGLKAGNKPMSAYQRKPGEVHGDNWYTPTVKGTQEFPHIAANVNHWKSFVHARLAAAPGDPGSLTLFGKPAEHRLFAEHIANSETYVITEGYGREVHEWSQKPHRPDNHWLDCLVGCAVGASIMGCSLTAQQQQQQRNQSRATVRYL